MSVLCSKTSKCFSQLLSPNHAWLTRLTTSLTRDCIPLLYPHNCLTTLPLCCVPHQSPYHPFAQNIFSQSRVGHHILFRYLLNLCRSFLWSPYLKPCIPVTLILKSCFSFLHCFLLTYIPPLYTLSAQNKVRQKISAQ